jgi:cold shock CspA family protein
VRVDFYTLSDGYGFCVEGDLRAHFRIEDFVRENAADPLPICGELVEAEIVERGDGRYRAVSLRRLTRPQRLWGRVKSFDGNKGWGFITSGGETYYLHRSDLIAPFFPVVGLEVTFFPGEKNGRSRACYVTPTGRVDRT